MSKSCAEINYPGLSSLLQGAKAGADRRTVKILERKAGFKFLCPAEAPIKEKSPPLPGKSTVPTGGVKATVQVSGIWKRTADSCCLQAKTRLGRSALGASGFTITVREELKVSAGAGFHVAYAGDIMTMPSLP